MSTIVLILIDGLRPDALTATPTPAIHSLIERGSSTFRAQTVMPSITLPCHTSLFHSVPPARHGITTNQWQAMARPLPGLVDVAAQQGKKCAFFYNWEELRDLSRPGSLVFSYCHNNAYTNMAGDGLIVDAAARFITTDQPDFAFVYLGTVDTIGHVAGWMSAEYLQQVRQADGFVGRLLQALPQDSTVLLQSDHGGHERNHGSDCAEDMTIPWIMAGPGIRQGYTIQSPVTILDSAPTLAHILNIPRHRDWEGQIVHEIFAPQP